VSRRVYSKERREHAIPDFNVDRSGTIVKEVNAALEHGPRISFHKHPLEIALDSDGALVLEGER
jgi:hypothetical protein